TAELQRLQQVILLMRSDTSEDAPPDVVAYAKTIFRKRAVSGEPALLRRIVAALSFDSMNVAPAYGVRSGHAASRQLVYSSESHDVDLRITPQNDQWVVAGQVLGEHCARGEVKLEGETGTAVAALNELCEFTLPAVSAGSYKLLLRLADVEVEVPRLELRA
ncbi:MAG: hypothetical protein ACRD6N_02435, partial [Pyrinomonadaceae bacterium]